MKNIYILIGFVLLGITLKAQKVKEYHNSTIGDLICISSSNAPQRAVKSKADVASTIDSETGITKRHSEEAGNGSNPNINAKVSPLFAVSPTDVKIDGTSGTEDILWTEASGWDKSTWTNANSLGEKGPVAATPTGCKAYKGPLNVASEEGKWRIPTMREMYLIWILKDKIEVYSAAPYNFVALTAVSHTAYWTSTEVKSWANSALMLSNDETRSMSGRFNGCPVNAVPSLDGFRKPKLRCVRDITD